MVPWTSWPWSTEGSIRKTFEHVSATQDNSLNVDCRIIYPWRLFDTDMKYEGIAYTIEQQLKNAS
jgi:hypothetical protein